MSKSYGRRDVLKGVSVATASLLLPGKQAADQAAAKLQIAGQDVEIQIAPVSANTFRLTVRPIQDGRLVAVPVNGALVKTSWGEPVAKFRAGSAKGVKVGDLTVQVSADALTYTVNNKAGETVQTIVIDQQTGGVSFTTGSSPLLGLGEGGPQFDRRGNTERMRSGQGGYRLGTNGTRVPIPWLIGTGGWAMFFNQPFGTFDFTGDQSKFIPSGPNGPLPLDLFVAAAKEPAALLAEYARLTGHPELPPLWSFGYQQSHRTLASRDEILSEAKTFRDKKLPCDALIYLGTGFCPSGWNEDNGNFDWNQHVFPDPKAILDEFHKEHFRAVLHVVILSRKLNGSVHDPCMLAEFDAEEASCYWDAHRKDFALGVDGWWPDEGDPLDAASRLNRNRFYWEAPQTDRPNERPYALHRNGYAGVQRYASFLWSGDVSCRWETLKTHIPDAVNTALSGIPYWGTDIGGFVPTKEFTAELYMRWFQFGAFCTLFRSHGRTWKLRLPWGWDTGETGPIETNAGIPDPSDLHNPQPEIVCRKYLDLRYRMLPYLYSCVREGTHTGLPVMRALWLHFPDDATAVARGDEYMWGPSILVAPVVEQGATSRKVYLPQGDWFDFWTGERTSGGSEITRNVDIETMPLYVRAGSIIPFGPLKQYTDEKVDGPLSITVYPGADASFMVYEDDGKSFNYRRGEWMGLDLKWDDAKRALTIRLAAGSRMLAPLHRPIEVKLDQATKTATFSGHPVTVSFA